MKAEDKLEHQLSILDYLIAKIEFYFAIGEVKYYFKRDWQDRLHKYMMKCLKQYVAEVSQKNMSEAFKAGRRYESYLRTKARRLNSSHYMPNFDNWFKEQKS